MTRDEFINSNIYLGKIVFIDSGNNQMWCEELLSSNSKKGKALLKRFPKGGSFTKVGAHAPKRRGAGRLFAPFARA